MMKKLLSFVCCLLPFSAGAVSIITQEPGTGASYGGDGSLTSVNVESDTVLVIKNGTGIVISKDGTDETAVSGGLNVENNVIIGQDNTGSMGGDLFAEVATNPTFTIQSDGNISVGAALSVLSGRDLGITTRTTGTTIDASFGSIDAAGGLTIQNIRNFTSGGIDSVTALSLSGQTITTGAIDVTGGTVAIGATGALKMDQFQTAGTQTDISAGSIESGNIQNNVGKMNIVVAGDLNTIDKSAIVNSENIGSIENSGTEMTISAQNVSVAGTVKNDNNNGSLTMNVASLEVLGGDATQKSFVNAGDLHLTVAGETNIKYGFDLSRMKADNEFYLKTGTLKFGSVDAADAGDAWLQVFAKDLRSFYLEITGGNVNANVVVNGSAASTGADMTIIGQSVFATSITNNAVSSATIKNKLQINATDSAGTLTVSGDVKSVQNSVTNIVSAGELNVTGTVSNNGTMLINANDVKLAGVANQGTKLDILSLTDKTGIVNISSDVSNKNGALTVNSRQIDITGNVTNYSGMTNIIGSDKNGGAVNLGGIDVQGGSFALDALVGSVDVTGGLSVTGGAFNVGENTHNLTVKNTALVNGDVTLSGVNAVTAGNMNIAATGSEGFVLKSETGAINIYGNVTSNDALASRIAQFDAKTISISKNVTARNMGKLIFGAAGTTSQTTITGNAVAESGGQLEFYSADTTVGSLSGNGLFLVHGNQITANTGAINVNGNLWFNGGDNYTSGMVVTGTDELTLTTRATGADIDVSGGVEISADNTLTINSADDATIGGVVVADGALSVTAAGNANLNNSVTSTDSLTVKATNITTKNITNSGDMDLTTSAGTVQTGLIENVGNATISATTINSTGITTGSIESTSGTISAPNAKLKVTATDLNTAYLTVNNGVATLDVTNLDVMNDITVSGDLVQTNNTATGAGMLNIVRDDASVSAKNLTIDGAFHAFDNAVTYDLSGDMKIGGAFTVDSGAVVGIYQAKSLISGALTNNGRLFVNAVDVTINGAIENRGDLIVSVSNKSLKADSFAVNTGYTILSGQSMTLTGAFGALDNPFMLYQEMPAIALTSGDVSIATSTYDLTASNVYLSGIQQDNTSHLTINTSDIKVDNDIRVSDLRIAANPSDNWLTVDVGGNVLGGTQFIGLESMKIGGNYKFDNNSQISAAILPYAAGAVPNTTTNNYWATVSLNEDSTLGKITNAADGAALIQVDGAFVSSASGFNAAQNGGALGRPQVGLTLFDIVDQGTAIWLLHADGGVSDESLAAKIRNLNVSFCNNNGTLCFDYLEALNKYNKTSSDLPAYISVRDSNDDGNADSLYVVFDPRFGGPVEVFKIQPIVGRVDDSTHGEYVSAGAIDNMIAGKLLDSGFYNRTPIEAIPLIFQNTNMATMASELYDRMEYYNLSRDGTGLARFSRLFQVRELEQIAGSIVLNEHTNFRSFEDRMFDEFIWNRNRNLKKAWLDFDYGMFYQDASDNKHINGNRFNLSGGFDWQESQTLLLGLTGRVSRMSSDNSDSMDLGYLPGQHIAGHVKTRVTDTDFGLGAYLMKILGQKTRIYGNGFLDIHILDVDREQDYVAKISGDGTAYSLMSEWGLLHDWLNQYVVGNMYARVGYNFGFNVNEKVDGSDYMKLKSDGYFTFTPGYSLTAQKRIYPSAWVQVRPYATIGVEYDVLGAPDSLKYKFAAANGFTSYDVDIDALWANIGGGVEILSATGIQVGIDYRYQYNSDIQLHNIRLSGSYRF